jgi:hypothetical protein
MGLVEERGQYPDVLEARAAMLNFLIRSSWDSDISRKKRGKKKCNRMKVTPSKKGEKPKGT